LLGAYVVWALLLAAVLPWRSGVYFEGGLDTVVIAKAVLSLIALAVAFLQLDPRRQRGRAAAFPVVVLVVYLAVTCVGGMINGTLAAAAVVASRVLILCVAVACLVSRHSAFEAMRALVGILGVVTVVATLSGLPALTKGRLHGVLPPLNPNELALFATVCCLWVFAKMLQGKERAHELLFLTMCVGVIVLTGSRTALGALTLALVVGALRLRALTRRSFVTFAALIPAVVFIVLETDLLSSLLQRGGEQGVQTLSNRTIAWEAALSADRGTLERLFGAGLTQKRIEVPGQWWTSQLLDSSWISALVQGGLIGAALVALLVAATILRAAGQPGERATFWLVATACLAARGFLESGLFDSSVSFLVLLVAALGVRENEIRAAPGRAINAAIAAGVEGE
jgi:hypothetical protein